MRLRAVYALLFILAVIHPAPVLADTCEVTLILCRPEKKQVRNIVELYERDILPLDRLRLICVYHEAELTDYQPTRSYVAENRLNWITYHVIKERVPADKLFTENLWRAEFARLVKVSDGIIFTGGMDIPPRLYGEETHLLTRPTTPVRSEYESSFLFHLLGGPQDPAVTPLLTARPHYAVLAICLGVQTLNIATGGTLVQDIPAEIYGLETVEDVLRLPTERVHSNRYLRALHPEEETLMPVFHTIRILPGSILADLPAGNAAAPPHVLSSHHQAIENLGRHLRVIATSIDGKIIEAVQHTRFPAVLGVQFHPEYYPLYIKTPRFKGDPHSIALSSLRSFLLSRPPSMPFHRAIWSWFARVLVSSRNSRMPAS